MSDVMPKFDNTQRMNMESSAAHLQRLFPHNKYLNYEAFDSTMQKE